MMGPTLLGKGSMLINAFRIVMLFATLSVACSTLSANESLEMAAVRTALSGHCVECHNSETAEGEVRFDNLPELSSVKQLDMLNRAENQVFFELMPPEDSDVLPNEQRVRLRDAIGAVLRKNQASDLDQRMRQPGYGNFIDHETLFSGAVTEKPFTPARRWLVSPQIFHERVNDVFKLEGRARQRKFYGVTNPIVLPDNSGVRYFDSTSLDGGHLLMMLNNADWISRKQIFFGKSAQADYQILEPSFDKGIHLFKIKNNEKIYKFKIQLPGIHNVYNAAAAIAVSMEEGVSLTAIRKGIHQFTGVGRRYEKHKLSINSLSKILIDDYGHHPIEVLSTIKAYKEEFPKKRMLMIFQPHRFSRTAQLFNDFIKVLKKVDSLLILDIYAASEKPIKGIDSRTIVETLKQQGHKDVTYLKNHDDINDLIVKRKDDFDILITQGAGSISTVCNSIIKKWKV